MPRCGIGVVPCSLNDWCHQRQVSRSDYSLDSPALRWVFSYSAQCMCRVNLWSCMCPGTIWVATPTWFGINTRVHRARGSDSDPNPVLSWSRDQANRFQLSPSHSSPYPTGLGQAWPWHLAQSYAKFSHVNYIKWGYSYLSGIGEPESTRRTPCQDSISKVV